MALSKKIVLILCIALLLRIVIAFWSLQFRENSDVLRYKDWARIGFLSGLANTYETQYLTFGTMANNQPPGSLYILSAAYQLDLQTAKVILKLIQGEPGSNQWINGPMLTLFMKLPSVFADILLGTLIYLFIKKRKGENNALLGSSLFLFTPPVWYNSAFWGQMDSVNNLMFFTAVFFLYEKKFFLSILSVFLSLFIKLSVIPGLFTFALLLFLHKQKKKWQLVIYILLSIAILAVLTIPILKDNIFWIDTFIRGNSLGEMQEITNFAFNFWWVLLKPYIVVESLKTFFTYSQVELINSYAADTIFWGIALRHWAIGLFFASLVPFLVLLYQARKHLTAENGILALSVALLCGFLFLPTMHERYLYPVLPLLAAYVGLQKKFLWVFILLSLLHLINLYIVWHPMMLNLFPPAFVTNADLQWSVSLGIFVTSAYFYICALRILRPRKAA